LIRDDRGIVDARRRKLGLVALRRSLLICVGKQHRHLHTETVPGGVVRNIPDWC
jgi:hypothetical protein